MKDLWKNNDFRCNNEAARNLVIKSTGELEIPIQTAVLFNIGYPRRTVKIVNSFVNGTVSALSNMFDILF